MRMTRPVLGHRVCGTVPYAHGAYEGLALRGLVGHGKDKFMPDAVLHKLGEVC